MPFDAMNNLLTAIDASVNATQEMLTLGLCNIVGSFASSMPTAGAFTRSAVSSASGIQTPMAGLYSGNTQFNHFKNNFKKFTAWFMQKTRQINVERKLLKMIIFNLKIFYHKTCLLVNSVYS